METGQYLGEISALCFLHLAPPSPSLPYLLAGTGSQLLFYDLSTSNMIASFQVFNGIRVHGITTCIPPTNNDNNNNENTSFAFTIAVFGERKLKLLRFDIRQNLVNLLSVQSLPNFGHWILDVCFLQDCVIQGSQFLAIGCTNNSVYFWDIATSTISYEVSSPDKCLLYTMRMWGEKIDSLHVACGTIFNEIIVWKVVPALDSHSKNNGMLAPVCKHQYEAVSVCRLAGHEGSIFRITWSLDGSKLVSVSDDRSARIWEVLTGKTDASNAAEVTVSPSSGPVLFGHSARVWDCCMSESLIITVGEDCTCRVWGLDGTQLRVIKEHIGRGVWRCLYDPNSSLLITAGFDSAIKVHQLHSSLPTGLEKCNGMEDYDRKQIFTFQIPNSKRAALMDSKSEYVRCMHFASEDALYVSTNNGVLYFAKIMPDSGDAVWTQLYRASEDIPIVCMSVFPGGTPCVENWIALGDGKGRLTVVSVDGSPTPKVNISLMWPAEAERQLLETFWCESLGPAYIFTADPRGRLKLWNIHSSSEYETGHINACLVAEITSSFSARIICLDASFEEEVLVCGDLRGNLIIYPLLRNLLIGTPAASVAHISPLTYFKGAHGISTVSSISIHGLSSSIVELHSTGGDGCICYMEYDKCEQKVEFIGMKQLKELSLVQSLFPKDNPDYAIGFASANFILWNLSTETKVAEIPCGGWRRPHTYFLGDVPEMKYCFAFVKDEVIYVHKHWVATNDRIYPQNLHLQFHGREMHSLCFIVDQTQAHLFQSGFIATGCEDGTVRLTRYSSGVDDWCASKLLGEHVGGSAVRSLCSVQTVHTLTDDKMDIKIQGTAIDDHEDQFLLISVGAKRVLTAWKRKISSTSKSEMSFQWLSSDFPIRNSGTSLKGPKKENPTGDLDNGSVVSIGSASNSHTLDKPEVFCSDGHENDWRYLAVTAFLVKLSGSRTSVCFIVVSCSDATVTLRALVLPHRLWFDIALLVPSTSPVLSLQHVIVPELQSLKDNSELRSLFMVISGSTDGSIAFWDVTETVETFMRRVSFLRKEDCINFQRRPRTGRGSQGGRQWRSLDMSREKLSDKSLNTKENPAINIQDQTSSNLGSSQETNMIQPLHVLKNVHQSGVNCLHVSDASKDSESCFSCNVISGGDDQALHSFCFSVMSSDRSTSEMNLTHENGTSKKYQTVFSHPHKIASAHSSAVKGVWTDGHWVFSTGLDQRLRCWCVSEDGKLCEHAHLIVSVPEPEALDVRVCGRNRYQIAVAGRGMQMMEFLSLADG